MWVQVQKIWEPSNKSIRDINNEELHQYTCVVYVAWGSFSSVLERPKSETLQLRFWSTRIFLAAKSRWIYFIFDKYRIPLAIPFNILTSWMMFNFAWFNCNIRVHEQLSLTNQKLHSLFKFPQVFSKVIQRVLHFSSNPSLAPSSLSLFAWKWKFRLISVFSQHTRLL